MPVVPPRPLHECLLGSPPQRRCPFPLPLQQRRRRPKHRHRKRHVRLSWNLLAKFWERRGRGCQPLSSRDREGAEIPADFQQQHCPGSGQRGWMLRGSVHSFIRSLIHTAQLCLGAFTAGTCRGPETQSTHVGVPSTGEGLAHPPDILPSPSNSQEQGPAGPPAERCLVSRPTGGTVRIPEPGTAAGTPIQELPGQAPAFRGGAHLRCLLN